MNTLEQIVNAKELKTVGELLEWSSENGHPMMCPWNTNELLTP